MSTMDPVLPLCIVIAIATIIWHIVKRRTHPPGPLGFPIFGIIPIRIKDLIFPNLSRQTTEAEKYKQNRDKYGPIWSCELGTQRIIVLSSWSIINEAFIDHGRLFSGKPNNRMYKLFGECRGFLLGNGEMWRGHRRLTIMSLKDLGMGKKVMEKKINDEGDQMVLYLGKIDTNRFNLLDAWIKCVANIAICLVFQERHDYLEPTFTMYAGHLCHVNHSNVFDTKLSLSPTIFQTNLMKKLFPDISQFLSANKFCSDFIKQKCSVRDGKQFEISEPKCVYDYFLRYRFPDPCREDSDSNSEEILQCMCDIFSAAIDTVSNFLSFSCLFLGKYPDLQRELRHERRLAVDVAGTLNLDCRKHCPRMLSFLDEVQRLCCIVPKVHHRVIEECTFHGYKLFPEDVVYGDLANLFTDPDLFSEPNKFDPYRFTDPLRTKYCPSKYVIPFGIGRRACLGESLAKMEVFLLLEKIVDKFEITLPEDTSVNFVNIIRGHSGILHVPLQHCMNLRLLNS